ncbi:MAG: tRNA uridine-5-carboxymethylaminomethyl(34) synthesis enzyme MnmG [candidate division Zixibacteria bacterium]|nr:tRNA uridine-5-carboxymethylaminomethyl(34) synthesis enzyme MnmG [candidate division Zixibacteria bacterium]
MGNRDFDILVVGGGHAGTEAVRMASRMKMKTGLVTMDKDKLALMSCNPAIGGVGKGHLVREVDALGGIIGQAADFSGIQFRRLNLSKGPAVRSTRVQCDRRSHCRYVSDFIASLPYVEVIEDEAVGLLIENRKVCGLKLKNKNNITAKAVILCTGTFLGGLIHIGSKKIQAGRRDEPAAIGMTESLEKAGFETARLKTGTPPRIDGNSIDYSKTEEQPGHEPAPVFSHFKNEYLKIDNSALCYLTYTTPETASIIHSNLDRAPLFSGQIEGTGPRYCPSIEDKVTRFSDKPRHQIFIEPEGTGTDEIYLNGFATSLPEDVQLLAAQTIIGMEECRITQPGYAIEYDFVPPNQLQQSLEAKHVQGLFMAGQINGTSGYEEAAAQGLISGLNASLYILKEKPCVPGRHEAYIGVMLDDIVMRNISEPYRMFTSRAEYRLALREDNALDRLSGYGKQYGIYSEDELTVINKYESEIADMLKYLEATRIKSSLLKQQFDLQTKRGSLSMADMICRPDFNPNLLYELPDNGLAVNLDVFEKAAILIKYRGYLAKQDREIDRNRKNESISIPDSIDYSSFSGLKTEAIEKLIRFHPTTLGQASRIEGVTPSDIAVLTIHLKRISDTK